MDSGMIGKILKARQYAEERDRVMFDRFSVTFRGENNDHKVEYQNGKWACTCDFFSSHQLCSHTMALERILDRMIHPIDETVAEADPTTSMPEVALA